MKSQHEMAGQSAVSRARYPALRLSFSDALPGASFALARADVRWSAAQETTGWGRDAEPSAAQCKALSEAVERHAYARLPPARRCCAAELSDHAFPGDDFPAVAIPAAALSTHCAKVLSPIEMLGYSTEQYSQPDFPFVPYAESQSYWWLPARHAIDQSPAWIVADLVCNPRAFEPDYRQRLLTHATSSGCASAAHIDTAAFRATLELVERDAFMRHWFAQQGGIAIVPASLPDPFIARFDRLRQAGCNVGLQCLDLGLHPVWMVWAQHARMHFTSIGLASGLDADTALDTAMSELETQALVRLAGVQAHAIRPEQVRSPADHAALYATSACFERADALELGRLAKPESEMQRHARVAAGFRIAMPALYRRLARHGHPVYLVDLSVAEAVNLGRDQADSCANQPANRHADHDGSSCAIHTVRALAPGLIPLAFGLQTLPLAMDVWQRPGSRFIHPFS